MNEVAKERDHLRRQVLQIHSFVWAVVHLDQTLVDDRLQLRCKDLCRLHRADQRAGINHVKLDVLQHRRRFLCLLDARIIQGMITPALQRLLVIQFRLSMSDYVNHFN